MDKLGYDLVKDQAVADLNAAHAELERLTPQTQAVPTLPPLAQVLEDLGGWASALVSIDTAGQRDILRELVDHVAPVRLARGKYRVDITWTALGDALVHLAATLQAAEPAA